MNKEELLRRLQELVDVARVVNMEYTGRPDCKACSVLEELERIIMEAK